MQYETTPDLDGIEDEINMENKENQPQGGSKPQENPYKRRVTGFHKDYVSQNGETADDIIN